MKRRVMGLLLAVALLVVSGAALAAPGAVVPRAQVKGLTAVSASPTSIDLEWEVLATATGGYQLRYNTDATFPDLTSKPISVSGTTYTVTGLTCGTFYYFQVRSVEGANVYGNWSETAECQPAPDGPSVLDVTAMSGTSAKLEWDEPSGITGYIVRRGLTPDSIVDVATVKSLTTYIDTGLTPGEHYYYEIVSYRDLGNDSAVRSVDKAEEEFIMIPPVPADFKSTNIPGGIRLTWKPVENISYYEVHRTLNDGADGYPVLATNITGTSLEDTSNIRIGSTYKYYIVAVAESTKSEQSEITVLAGPATPTGLNAFFEPSESTTINVIWDSVNGATAYVLEYSDTSKNGSWVELTRGYFTAYQDKGLTVGKGRYYRVKSVVATYESEPSAPVYDAARPAAVKDLKLTNRTATSIKLSWKASTGAVGYRIYRSTSENGTYKLLSKQPGTSYIDKKLTEGTTYYYRVEPYILDPRDGTTIMPGVAVKGSLTAEPPGPEIIDVGQYKRTNGLLVKWNKISGGTGYRVYFRLTGTDEYILAAEVSNSKSKAIIPNLNPGAIYDIGVRKVYKVNGKESLGAMSKVNSVELPLLRPKGLSKTAVDATSFIFKWTPVDGVDGYEVKITGTQDGYLLETSTDSAQVTVNETVLGYDYVCRVRSWNMVGQEKLYSSWSSAITLTPTSPAPTNFKATPSVSKYQIVLSWTGNATLDGYFIERSLDKSSGFTRIGKISESGTVSFTDSLTSADVGQTYYYRMCGYHDAMGSLYSTPYTAVVSAQLLPAQTTVKLTNVSPTSIRVRWDKVDGADGYRIYRSTSANGEFKLIKTIKSGSTVSYKNSGLTTGTTYYYRVAAYQKVSKKTIVGTLSDTVALKAAPKKPTIILGEAAPKSITLTWKKVSGASGYYIYRRLSGSYKLVGTVTSGSTVKFTDKNLSGDTTYRYRVSAYTLVNNVPAEGQKSSVFYMNTATPQVQKLSVKPDSTSSVKLTWKEIPDVDGYQVQMSKDGVSFSHAASSTKAQATVKNLAETTKYQFRVRAFVKKGSSYSYGAWSDVVSGNAGPKAPAELEASNVAKKSITLTWKASSGATGYIVWMKAPGESKFSKLVTVTGKHNNTYQVTGLKSKNTYQFKVTAITEAEDGTIFNGSTTAVIKVKTN